MLTADDLAGAARIALDRLELERDSAETDLDCRLDHFDLTLAGVEEGLKLAMLVLRQQSGPTRTSGPDLTARDESRELHCPSPEVSYSPNGR